MSKKKNSKPINKNVEYYVELADTYDQSNPNQQMTGLLQTEDEAREVASVLLKTIGSFDRLYITSTDNRSYSFK